MKQIIFPILASLFILSFVGCKKDNRPPLVRANELLRKNHLPEVPRIDSVFGYEDVYDEQLSASRFSYIRDSLRMISRERELTEEEKKLMEEFNSNSDIFLGTSQKLLLEHKKNGDKEEFIGYGCLMADSTSDLSTYYFIDKDFKEVQVTKKLFFAEDYY